MSAEEIREDVELLTQELLVVLMDIAETEPEWVGGEGELAVRQALTELTRFRNRRSMADNALSDLASAKELLDRAMGHFDSHALREALADASSYLDGLRKRTIDKVVESDRRGGAQNSIYEAPQELTASVGSPAMLFGIQLALPRVMPPEETLARTRENSLRKIRQKLREREPQPKSRGGTEGERQQVEVHARDLMEDLAAYSSLRLLSDEEVWQSSKAFEERLLMSLDALFTLARPVRVDAASLDLAEALYAYATEWVIPDRGRTFAFAFTLSSVSHPSASLWMMMGFRAAEDRALDAYVDAFAMSPNPKVPEQLASLISDDLSREQTIAVLRGMVRRRVWSAGRVLSLASHPDWEIAAAAVRCLANAPAQVQSTVLPSHAEDGSVAVRAVAASLMVERAMPNGARTLRSLAEDLTRGARPSTDLDAAVRAAMQQCLTTLAVLGEAQDEERVWSLAHRLEQYREVGFFGAIGHVPKLFATMEALDAVAKATPIAGALQKLDAAAAAIHRISGVEVPSYGSGRYDLVAFSAAWAQRAADLGRESGRLRFGKPWEREDCVRGLGDPASKQGDRRLCAAELLVASKGELSIDVETWVNAQETLVSTVASAWSMELGFQDAWRVRTHKARSR